ncbi:MAG: PAS domain S-box protein [Coleofasciculaceae cyanobacterium]
MNPVYQATINDYKDLKILLIEDNYGEAELIEELLLENSTVAINLTHVEYLGKAIDLLEKVEFDVILLDLSLPDYQGIDTVAKIQEYDIYPPIVVLTARNDQELALKLLQFGIQDYLVKGNVSGELLIRSLRYAVERQVAREALRRSEEKYRFVVNNVREVIFQTDIEGYWIFLNPAWTDITGFSVVESLGNLSFCYIHPDDYQRNMLVFRTLIEAKENYCRYQIRYLNYQGKFRWVEVNARLTFTRDGQVSGTTGTLNDITEQKLAQEALRQSEMREREKAKELEAALHQLQHTHAKLVQDEKMVSLGQLVAGVAHEINNPVGFIYSNIAPAREYTTDLLGLIKLYQQEYPQQTKAIKRKIEAIDLNFLNEDFLRLLNSMEDGANRIKEIILSLRNFSHLDRSKMTKADLHKGIDSTLNIIQHRLREQSHRQEIQVIKKYDKLPYIECYPGQLNQVFMNILSNAIDAIEKKIHDGHSFIPTLEIITKFNETSQTIEIDIADNGSGMTADVKQRLFDPFFTTKAVGTGTGLGLSISYSIIVEQHQGNLECKSQIDKGSEFMIELPILPGKRL